MNYLQLKSWLWQPEEFLQKIGFDANSFWGMDIIPNIMTDFAMELYCTAEVEKIRSVWMTRFYLSHHLDRKAYVDFEEQNKEQGFTQHSLLTVSELVKNFFEHGNKNKPHSVAYLGYWMTERGIILGARDEGIFYSDLKTAKKFEQKFMFESTKEDPSVHGIEGFYDDSDFLQVVPNQNALFMGFLFNTPAV